MAYFSVSQANYFNVIGNFLIIARRCQFHQHFLCAFFALKCFSLVMFWQKKHFRMKKARVKC